MRDKAIKTGYLIREADDNTFLSFNVLLRKEGSEFVAVSIEMFCVGQGKDEETAVKNLISGLETTLYAVAKNKDIPIFYAPDKYRSEYIALINKTKKQNDIKPIEKFIDIVRTKLTNISQAKYVMGSEIYSI